MNLLGDMTILPHSNQLCVDIFDGTSDAIEQLNSAVTDELRERFRENPPRLSLPIIWDFEIKYDDGSIGKGADGHGGPPVDDPLTLYLRLPLADEEDGVVFKCSLEEVIDDLIDSCISPTTHTVVEASGQVTCRRVAARLRELAEHLERTLASQAEVDE